MPWVDQLHRWLTTIRPRELRDRCVHGAGPTATTTTAGRRPCASSAALAGFVTSWALRHGRSAPEPGFASWRSAERRAHAARLA